MRAEAPVFDGDHRIRHIGRKLGEVDRLAAGVAAIADQPSVDSKNLDVGRTIGDAPLRSTRQLGGEIGDHADAGDRHRGAEREDQTEG